VEDDGAWLFFGRVFGRVVRWKGGVGWDGKERAVQSSVYIAAFGAYWVVYSDEEYPIIKSVKLQEAKRRTNPS
jgi:hypothetical protein